MLVLICLPCKDGKLSWLRQKRRPHKDSNLVRGGIKLGTFWLEGRDLTTFCANHVQSLAEIGLLLLELVLNLGVTLTSIWTTQYRKISIGPEKSIFLWINFFGATNKKKEFKIIFDTPDSFYYAVLAVYGERSFSLAIAYTKSFWEEQ